MFPGPLGQLRHREIAKIPFLPPLVCVFVELVALFWRLQKTTNRKTSDFGASLKKRACLISWRILPAYSMYSGCPDKTEQTNKLRDFLECTGISESLNSLK